MGGRVASTIEVTILGRKIPLKKKEDEEYIRKVAEYVRDKVEEIQKQAPNTGETNVAILTALNIADELFSATEKQKETFSQIDSHCSELIEFIDTKLTA